MRNCIFLTSCHKLFYFDTSNFATLKCNKIFKAFCKEIFQYFIPVLTKKAQLEFFFFFYIFSLLSFYELRKSQNLLLKWSFLCNIPINQSLAKCIVQIVLPIIYITLSIFKHNTLINILSDKSLLCLDCWYWIRD